MKIIKKIVAVGMSVFIIGAAGMVYAADIKTPAEIASALTGKTVTEVNAQRESGKTYGAIASDAGKLDEFKAQMLEQKKAILDQRVKDGQMTQQQADDTYNAIKNNQASCDGTGSAGIGRKSGAGFGKGMGMGRGAGAGCGYGSGSATGCGMGYSK